MEQAQQTENKSMTQSENKSMPQNNERTVNLANLSSEDCLNLIFNALNKANSNGVFQLDEAYVLKIAHNHLKQQITSQENNE